MGAFNHVMEKFMDDPRLAQFGQFTPEGTLQPGYGDHYLFFVGRDDIHSILLNILQAETLAFRLNMFGYDDDELNQAIIALIRRPGVFVQGTLDRSQAAGVHEKRILEANATTPEWSSSFAIGQSETHQISHTKGGVLAGQGIGFEGSTNWSASAEGTSISLKADVANPPGFKAQNNTLLLSTNPVYLVRFTARLDAEHRIAVQQQATHKTKAP
ncbi:hypothetical protein [Leifsonia xyli]|uniref:hypothetical protein n=1 Tax=Leifsonia xyli TaxID=1575 RepID=UPI00159EFF9F|nr:hypothetical protein [Leifsonia xyli]